MTIAPTIRRNTIIFALAQALHGAGITMLVTLGALTVVHLTGSVVFSGLAVTTVQGSRLVVSYPLGKISDSFGRRPAMLVGLGLGLLGAPLLAISILLDSFALFVVSTLIFGMGVGAAQQMRVAVADMYPAERRGQAIGYLLTGSLVGALAGPIIVSGTESVADSVQINSLALPWMVLPVLILASMALVLWARPDPKEIGAHLETYWPGHKENETPAPEGPALGMGLRRFLMSRPMLTAVVCFAPAQGVMVMMMAGTPLVLDHHGHGLTAISLAVTIHVFGMYGFSIPLGRLADHLGRKPVLAIGLVVAGLGTALVPVTGSYAVIVVGVFLVGIGWSAVFVAATALIADATQADERGRAIGINDSLAAAFAITLPTLGGVMANSWGLLAVGMVGAGMLALTLPLMWGLQRRAPGAVSNVAG